MRTHLLSRVSAMGLALCLLTNEWGAAASSHKLPRIPTSINPLTCALTERGVLSGDASLRPVEPFSNLVQDEKKLSAIESDASDSDEGHLSAPDERVTGLERLRQEGMQSWDEFFESLQKEPRKLSRLYVDADDTLFMMEGYVGSENWYRDERAAYPLSAASVSRQKMIEEKRLLASGEGVVAVEPSLVHRLKDLQAQGISIIVLTARDLSAKPQTETILKHLGLGTLRVHYAGRYRSKLDFIHKDMEEKPLAEGEVGAVIDDRLNIFVKPDRSKRLAEQGIYAIAYHHKRRFNLSESLEAWRRNAQHPSGIRHAVDTLILAKGYQPGTYNDLVPHDEARQRARLYQEMDLFVERTHDDRLTMSYVESVSNYFAEGHDRDLAEADRAALARSLIRKLAPYNVEAIVDGMLRGDVKIRPFKPAYRTQAMESRYEIMVDEKNVYLFCEPLIRYLRQTSPALVVFPATGALPFKRMVDSQLKAEGLDHIHTLQLPISRNRAGDTLYEIRRWLLFARHPETAQSEEEHQFAALGNNVPWDRLVGQRIVVFDDNITSGVTGQLIEAAFQREAGIRGIVGLTPFSYSAGRRLPFPLVGTLVLAGTHQWATGEDLSPPLILSMPWENEKIKKSWYGVRSRRRFEPPTAVAQQIELRTEEAQRLQAAFEHEAGADQAASSGRPDIIPERGYASTDGGSSLELAAKGQGLPSEFAAGSVRLKRLTGPVPPWILNENLLTSADAQMLMHSETLRGAELSLYEVRDAGDRAVGIVVTANAFSENEELSLVIRKMSPRRGVEGEWKPQEVVDGIQSYVRMHQEVLAIRGVYMNTDPARIKVLSESHAVRRALEAAYGYYPNQQLDLEIAPAFSAWIGAMNALWKILTRQEQTRRRETQRILVESGVFADPVKGLLSPMARVVLLARQRSQLSRLRKLMSESLQVPISPLDWRFIQWIGSQSALWVQKVDPENQNRRRIEILLDQISKTPETEEPLDVEDILQDIAPSDSEQDKVVKMLTWHLFQDLWDRGGDLTSLSRDDFQGRGLLWLWDALGGEPLAVLNRLTENGVYIRENGAIKVDTQRPVTEDQFKRYVRGEWWAIAPGTTYTLTGRQPAEKNIGNPGSHFIFLADESMGIIAHGGTFEKKQVWIASGKTGMVFIIKNLVALPAIRVHLFITLWKQLGGDVGQRSLENLRMVWDKGRARRSVWMGSEELYVQRQANCELLARWEKDPVHGTVLLFEEESQSGDQPGFILKEAYRFHSGEFDRLNSRTSGRTMAYWDIAFWIAHQGHVGEMMVGREFHTKTGVQGKVYLGDRSWPTGFTSEGQRIVIRLEMDPVHGVIMAIYPDTGQAPGFVLAPSQAYRFVDGQLDLLNRGGAEGRIPAFWDLADWVRCKGIVDDPLLGREIPLIADKEGAVSIGGTWSSGVNPGEPFIGRLEKVPGHGVVMAFYRAEVQNGKRVLTLVQAHRFKNGKREALMNTGVTGYTIAHWDIKDWLTEKGAVSDELLGHEIPIGKVRTVLQNTLSTGFLDGESGVMQLERDPVHGVLLMFYAETMVNRQRVLVLTQAYRFKNGKRQSLNVGEARGRSPIYWDVADWVETQGVEVPPILDREEKITANEKRLFYLGHRYFYAATNPNEAALMRLTRAKDETVVLVFNQDLGTGMRGAEMRRYAIDNLPPSISRHRKDKRIETSG